MIYDEQEQRIHTAGARAMVAEAARIRAELCESRGLPPSSGCRTCGRPRGDVAQCEQFHACDWPVVALVDEADDTQGGGV